MLNLLVVCKFLLVLIVRCVISQESPCPDILQYSTDGKTNFGLVTVQSAGLGRNFTLEVKLSARIRKTDSYGTVNFTNSEEDTLNDIYEGKPIHYTIHFPPKDQSPVITRLKMNNNIICRGKDIYGNGITRITLSIAYESTLGLDLDEVNNLERFRLYDIRSDPGTKNSPISPSTQRNIPKLTTTRGTSAPAVRASISKVVTNIRSDSTQLTSSKRFLLEQTNKQEVSKICGRSQSKLSPFIANGKTVKPGDWPWLAGLFLNNDINIDFLCGASLITSRTLITAAHCIHYYETVHKKEKIIVAMGVHYISDLSRGDVKIRSLEQIELHSDFDNKLKNFEADIAILITTEPFSSENIIPVCLWNNNLPNYMVGKFGTVVGWGKNEKGKPFTEEPMEISEEIVSNDQCKTSNDIYKRYVGRGNFCAGGNNQGPCEGDSGGGLYLLENGVWYLRGVVSSGFENNNLCNISLYAVYTDVSEFLKWIEKHVKY